MVLTKIMPLRNVFISLLSLLCTVFTNSGIAQNCIEQLTKNELYSNSKNIINGTKWIYELKYLGSPLLTEKYWPKADIVYNGVHYIGIQMNYNVYKNEIIIYYPEKGNERYVVISNKYLSGFSFFDSETDRKHSYEYIELPGFKGKALYENASIGKTSFFIKPMKTIEVRSSGNGQGEFSSLYEYYIDVGNGFKSFSSKSQFIKLLAKHSTELKRFIRKNKLKINYKQPENIIPVLNYFDGLD
jgi:hypothetical protein